MTSEKSYSKKLCIENLKSFHPYAFQEEKQKEKKDLLISIVIPVFNEEYSIKKVIKKIPNHYSYEIIIVDDGSTDNSIKKVREINDQNIKIIQHGKNKGYGAALLTGFRNTAGNIIVTLDSDGQHDPKEIPNLIEPIISNKADMVIGSRYLGKSHYKIPLYTRLGEYFVNTCLRLLFRQKVTNNQCGFRAISSEIINRFTNLRQIGMGFSTELIFKVAFYKFKIIEVPISVNPRYFGSSYVQLFKITKSILSCIVFYTLRWLKLKINNPFLIRISNFFYTEYKKIKN
ncbi:MAG: glycosyltransferase family 2 protein [Promethearchaeota archaeon]